MAPHSQELFLIRGKNELESYQVYKSLWVACENVSGLDEEKVLPKTPIVCQNVAAGSEPYRHLINFLF